MSPPIFHDTLLTKLGVPISEIEYNATVLSNVNINEDMCSECSTISSLKISKSNYGQDCQICKFEGCGRKLHTVFFV